MSTFAFFNLDEGPNAFPHMRPSNGMSRSHIQELVSKLPRLSESDVNALGHRDSVCPICFVPLLAILAEEETALAMDSPAHPTEELGVTKLAEPWQCGHVFCRKDISKWINDAHDTCPTCRRRLVSPSSVEQDISNVESDVPLSAHTQDRDRLMEEIQRQLSTYAQGFAVRAAPPNEDDSSRDDFTGMYS